jgi:hypothetical protein
LVALVAAAGCSEDTKLEAGPGDRFYYPTGMAVTANGKLVVASSNFDLRYDDETGGSVIAVDPALEPAPLLGTINVRSFGGQLAIADPGLAVNACEVSDPTAGAIALLPVRGSNVLYRLRVAADGALSCSDCALPIGSTTHVDPYSVGVACSPGLARAYVGYLRSSSSQAVVTQVDLTLDPSQEGAVRDFLPADDSGQVRGFAYDAARGRLYLTHTVTAAGTSLRWVDIGGKIPCADPLLLCPCRVDQAFADGGCATGTSVAGAVPNGLELRGIALESSAKDPSIPAGPIRRAYLTARIYDPVLAAAAGVRVGDFDGLLIVADLVETLGGRLDLQIVRELPIGYGASDVVVLPARAGMRDVVAALAADDGLLWIYDDETGAAVMMGRDLTQPEGDPTEPTGAPLVGHSPFGLAVSPILLPGDVARLYVGSFEENGFVTPVNVPLATPAAACLVAPGGAAEGGPEACVPGPDITPLRIRGGVTP